MAEIIKFEQFRSQNAPMDRKLFEHHVEFIESEIRRMRREGLGVDEINENIFSDIISGLGGGFTDILKNYIIDWAAERLGVQTHDEAGQPTFFYQLVRNIIEKMEWTKVGSYFGKGSCSQWAKALVLGLADTIEEKSVTMILGALGMQIDDRGGLATTLAKSIQQGLQNALNDTEFMKNIENIIDGKLCGANFGDILGGMTRSDSEKVSNQIQKASEENPNILKKAATSGIMDVLTKSIAP